MPLLGATPRSRQVFDFAKTLSLRAYVPPLPCHPSSDLAVAESVTERSITHNACIIFKIQAVEILLPEQSKVTVRRLKEKKLHLHDRKEVWAQHFRLSPTTANRPHMSLKQDLKIVPPCIRASFHLLRDVPSCRAAPL